MEHTNSPPTSPPGSPGSTIRRSRAKSLTGAMTELWQSKMLRSPSKRLRAQSKSPTKARTRLRKPLPKQLEADLKLKTLAYNNSTTAVSKMYDMFGLPPGSANLKQINEALTCAIQRNLEAHEVLRLRRKVIDYRLRHRDISAGYYQLKITKLVRKYHQLGRQLHLLEKRKVLEEEQRTKSTAFHDEDGLLNALHRLLFYFPKGPRKNRDQALMKRKTIELYGLKAPETVLDHDRRYWDVICGKYLPRDEMVCAHIVPRSIPNQVVNFVCGPGSADELDTYRNAICMPAAVEKAMDKGELVIMPLDPTEQPAKRFMIRLTLSGTGQALAYRAPVDGELKDIHVKDLDGRELIWPNELRPKLRFLYFKWIHAVTINHLYKQHLVVPHFDELKTKEAWMTVGPWLRKSVLLEMAKYSDCMDDEEIERVLGRIEDEDQEVRARSVIQLVGHTLIGSGDPARVEAQQVEDEERSDSEYEEELEMELEMKPKVSDIFYDSETETREDYAVSIRGPVSGIGSESEGE